MWVLLAVARFEFSHHRLQYHVEHAQGAMDVAIVSTMMILCLEAQVSHQDNTGENDEVADVLTEAAPS